MGAHPFFSFLGFLIRRLVAGVLVLWVVATLTFFLLRIIPGGPFDREKPLPPEIIANLEAKYHLDEPLWQQYLRYMGGLLQGDLGPSYKYLDRTVQDILLEAFPVSLELGLVSLGLAVALGLPLGVLAAARRGHWLDHLASGWAMLGISLPHFVLGALLVLIFSHLLRWLPPALWEDWRHLILPAATLSLAPAAYLAQLTRASLLEVLEQDFIRTARAKGAGILRILLLHGLRCALMPVVTLLGPLTAALVTGSFVIEYLFSIPGLGRHFITSVVDRDYPVIMGTTLVYAALIVVANLVVDLVYGLLDPRVRST